MKRTAAQRKRMSRAQKKRYALTKTKVMHHAKEGTLSRPQVEISYAYGKCETIIEQFAAKAGISAAIIAEGVGELLLYQAGRNVPRIKHQVP